MTEPKPGIYYVREILSLHQLTLPSYQRPYAWQARQVLQLLEDIREAMDRQPVYRIGTLILQEDETGVLNVVDGQQRLVTLLIILYVCGADFTAVLDADFGHETSQKNISAAQATIVQWFKGLPAENHERFLAYLLDHCQAVTIVLYELAEAFQFFDAQNARGLALEPTDLLKAYHLREMAGLSQEEQLTSIRHWESISQEDIKSLVGTYLFRIRRWSRGKPAGYFTKEELEEFKGLTLANSPDYPYLIPYRLNSGNIEGEGAFPFQITGPVINGQRFFEMISHYQVLFKQLFDGRISAELREFHTHTCYPGAHRNGDRYTKRLYKAAVLAYYDRFGVINLAEAYPLLFMWAYKQRIELRSVRFASANAYVLEKGRNVFQLIADSYHPVALRSLRGHLQLERVSQDIQEVRQVFEEHGLDYEG